MIWDVALIYTLIWSMQLVLRLLSIERALEPAHLGHRTVRLSATCRYLDLSGARAGGFSGDLGSLYMYWFMGLNTAVHMLVVAIVLGWLVGLPFAARARPEPLDAVVRVAHHRRPITLACARGLHSLSLPCHYPLQQRFLFGFR